MRYSPRRNSRVVLSRKYLRRMEVQWLPLVDPRQTYALPTLILIALIAVCVYSWLWQEHSLVSHRSVTAQASEG